MLAVGLLSFFFLFDVCPMPARVLCLDAPVNSPLSGNLKLPNVEVLVNVGWCLETFLTIFNFWQVTLFID